MSEIVEKGLVTIISVVIITIIGSFFKIGNFGLFYASIAAVLVSHVQTSKLLELSKNRAIGTIIGAVIGILFAYIPIPLILKIIIGEIICIAVCEKGLKFPSSSASITFLIIMFKISPIEPYIYGIIRVSDTFLGLIVAIIVAFGIKKLKAKN